jgi:hypothetical protein
MGIIARFTAVRKVGGHAAIGWLCRLIVAVSPYFKGIESVGQLC